MQYGRNEGEYLLHLKLGDLEVTEGLHRRFESGPVIDACGFEVSVGEVVELGRGERG
jgi:hypothetical protein